jgi:CxxC motif-containing protein (DUF1111 family)
MKRALIGILLSACGDDSTNNYEPGEELSGGETTVFDEGANAFSLAARNLVGDRRDKFFVGNSLFKRAWVTAPSSTSGVDGLGPTYNATSCAACHFKDGRGAPPQEPGEEFLGLLVRLSVPGEAPNGGPLGDPVYGGQFNHKSILTVPAEGTSSVTYVEVPGTFGDGTAFSLRTPTYDFTDLAFGPFAEGIMFSPRTGQAMIGLGLLEALDETTIVALADEADADGDGISGRANYVADVRSQTVKLGRFGWKANQPSLEQQVSGAFNGDIGITSELFPTQNCPPAQTACSASPDGGAPEIAVDKIDEVTYYSQLLAVPARRNFQDPTVLRGKAMFLAAGCASCHTPKLVTGSFPGVPEISGQTIFPFTDLLLHDMGSELADHRPDFLATGTEWRTAPLWGIGLVQVVNRHTNFMHDGRARDLGEAILWHGGEGEAAREAYRLMPASDREAMLAFLESL